MLLEHIGGVGIDVSIQRDNGASKKGLYRVTFLLGDVAGHASSPAVDLADLVSDGGPYVDKFSDEGFAYSYLLLLQIGLGILISTKVTYVLFDGSDEELAYSGHQDVGSVQTV